MIRVLLLLVMVIFATPVEANQIAGPAKAVDSTVIEVNGQRIMLFGIDSVMRKQNCTIDGKIWQCWAAAVRALLVQAGLAQVQSRKDLAGIERCSGGQWPQVK